MIVVPRIISRREWGARYAAGAGPAPLPAREVWLHHSVTVAPDLVPPFDDEDAAMRVLEQIGEDRFDQGVSYTFAVMPTGRIYEGHGVDRLGAHTAKRNGIARAIVLVGNYDTTEPTAAQIESTAVLLVDGERQGWWTGHRLAGGHQQAPGAATACPGRHAMKAITAINHRADAIAAGAPILSEDDMSLTPAQAVQLDDILKNVLAIRQQDLVVLRERVIPEAVKAIQAGEVPDVDEDALALALAPLLALQLERLPLEDLQQIINTAVTEQTRRLSAALAAAAPLQPAPLLAVDAFRVGGQAYSPELDEVPAAV